MAIINIFDADVLTVAEKNGTLKISTAKDTVIFCPESVKTDLQGKGRALDFFRGFIYANTQEVEKLNERIRQLEAELAGAKRSLTTAKGDYQKLKNRRAAK